MSDANGSSGSGSNQPDIAFDDDFGYVEVSITAGGQQVQCRLDLLEVQSHLTDIAKRFTASPSEKFYAAVQEYMQELGFPKSSLLTAQRFADRIVAAVEVVRKKVEASPASPASTG